MTAADLTAYEQIEACIVRAAKHSAWALFAEQMAAGVPPDSRIYSVDVQARPLAADDEDDDGEQHE